jgi:hypothetical protein
MDLPPCGIPMCGTLGEAMVIRGAQKVEPNASSTWHHTAGMPPRTLGPWMAFWGLFGPAWRVRAKWWPAGGQRRGSGDASHAYEGACGRVLPDPGWELQMHRGDPVRSPP